MKGLRLAMLPVIFGVLAFFPCLAGANALALLSTPPLGERWFGIYLNDERTGFAHVSIEEASDGYHVYSESAVKMSGIGFSRESTARESYVVKRDLTLTSLDVSLILDGKHMKLTGKSDDRGIRILIESGGTRKEKVLASKGPVYPSAILNLCPLFRGISPGKQFHAFMLDVEDLAIKDVRFTFVGKEKLGGFEAIHLRNDLYPVVDNDIWLDLQGNTLKESVRDGWIETRAEDERVAKLFLADGVLSRSPVLADFSLIPVDRPITDIKNLRHLTVELSGVPEMMPLFSGAFQKSERLAGDKVLFTLDIADMQTRGKPPAEESSGLGEYLAPSEQNQIDNPDIVRGKTEIIQGVTEPRLVVAKLARWVAENVKVSATGRRLPVETLRSRSGDSRSKVQLFISLARAAGIPTRFVSGIAYEEGKGFRYHCWAECQIGYWIPVDPFSGITPVDPTHIKLVEGDADTHLAALAEVIGRIRARIIRQDYFTEETARH